MHANQCSRRHSNSPKVAFQAQTSIARVCVESNKLAIQHATSREPNRSHSDAASSNARAWRQLRHLVKAGDGASYIIYQQVGNKIVSFLSARFLINVQKNKKVRCFVHGNRFSPCSREGVLEPPLVALSLQLERSPALTHKYFLSSPPATR